MSVLNRGQRCIVIAGCPKNIGTLVEILDHLGEVDNYQDCYEIVTISGRPFPELWADGTRTRTVPGVSSIALTERYKIRPLIDLPSNADANQTKQELVEIN
jgi:hypothetical protein